MRVNGLIPARFLVLISHIVITVTIFISRDLHIKASLSTTYTTAEYNAEDLKFIIVLAVSCFLFAFELLSFLFGVTIHHNPLRRHRQLLLLRALGLELQPLLADLRCDHRAASPAGPQPAHRAGPPQAAVMKPNCTSPAATATASHFAGSVALLLFLLDSWPVNDFFYIFGFCIAFPAVTEVFAIISAFSYSPKSAEAPAKSSKQAAGQRGGAKAS
uniref:Transmembrane protein 107 n=2 Tax=Macrostomum lignano TaxID=282301 RepID=A0A1I8IAG0_9PLAT